MFGGCDSNLYGIAFTPTLLKIVEWILSTDINYVSNFEG
jgi:hypothetical protein